MSATHPHAPSNAREFALQRDLIRSSRRALHLGFFSWVPLMGLFFGPAALMHFVRARHWARKVWNPVEWQRRLGGILAISGMLLSAIFVLVALGEGFAPRISPALTALGFVIVVLLFGVGLWTFGSLVDTAPFQARWQRIASTATPMIAWTALWLVLLLPEKGLRTAALLLVWGLLASPAAFLLGALFVPRINAFFHRHIWLAAFCAIFAWIIAAVSPRHFWSSLVAASDFQTLGGTALWLLLAGAIITLARLGLRRFAPAVRRWMDEHPDLTGIYTLAWWLTATLLIFVLLFGELTTSRPAQSGYFIY